MMIRIFAVKCYRKDSGRLRKVYIQANDETDLLVIIEEMAGYHIRSINEDYNHLPNNHQLMKFRKIIKQYEKDN